MGNGQSAIGNRQETMSHEPWWRAARCAAPLKNGDAPAGAMPGLRRGRGAKCVSWSERLRAYAASRTVLMVIASPGPVPRRMSSTLSPVAAKVPRRAVTR